MENAIEVNNTRRTPSLVRHDALAGVFLPECYRGSNLHEAVQHIVRKLIPELPVVSVALQVSTSLQTCAEPQHSAVLLV